MLEIEQNALKKALQLLVAAKCSFAVIDPEGNKHGTLEVVMPKKRQRAIHAPVGTLVEHTRKYLSEIQPGQSAVVPGIEGVALEAVRSSVTSWASQTWGNGSYISCINADKTSIEILRLE